MLVRVLLGLLFATTVLATLPSPDMQTSVVNLHNQYRANVAPAAAPQLPGLTWNTTLASYASNYADGCVYQHNPANLYGENIAAYSTSLSEVFLLNVTSILFSIIFNSLSSHGYFYVSQQICGAMKSNFITSQLMDVLPLLVVITRK